MKMLAKLGGLKFKGKLVLSMLVAGILPLIIAGAFTSYQAGNALSDQASRQLESLRAVKKANIEHYFGQISDQVITYSEDTMIVEAMKEFKQGFHDLPQSLDTTDEDKSLHLSKLTNYYENEFAKEFAKQNGESVSTSNLLPTDAETSVAQYLYIANNSHPLGSKDTLDKSNDGSAYSESHGNYHPIIRNYLDKFGYYDIFLVDSDTGHIVYSVYKELDYATSLKTGPYSNTNFAEVYKQAAASQDKDAVFLEDFKAYLPSYNGAASFIASPIFDGDKQVGVLIFQMPVGRINDIMQQHDGMGESGETYLVGSDLLMRSQSRFSEENTLLATKIDTLGANEAIKGETGIKIFPDYRNIPVLSAYSPLKIEGLNWAIMAEIDEAEALATVSTLQLMIMLLGLVTAVAVAVFAFVYARRVARRVVTAVEVAQEIAEGNFNNEIHVDSTDELGDMLKALEYMQTELFGRITREKNEALRILEALENVSANVMVADAENNIIYMNGAVKTLFTNAESELKKELPGFDASALIGSNIDQFHKNPAHQRDLLKDLKGTYESEFKISDFVLSVTANPIVNSSGERLGTVVEWTDLTEQRNAEHQIQGLIHGASEGELDWRMQDIEKFDGFMRSLSEGINQMLDSIVEPIKQSMNIMSNLAEGDLTKSMDGEYKGQFAEMQEAVNSCTSNLLKMVNEIRGTSGTIATSSNEISQGNTNLSQRTEEQASSLEETASSLEEMTGIVRQNADNARQANQLASGAREQAEKGGEVVGNAVTAMSGINQSSKKISDIIGVIDEIAFQTNLLALNAAVEAARAGDQGRGFAVVASEVRNLAQRSAGAAKEIKTLINDSVLKVEEGSKLVDESGATLEEIVNSVKKVSDIIAEIAAASEEQSSGIDQINTAVSQMDEMTQQNAALVEEAAAASESMDEQATSMNELMEFFDVGKVSQKATQTKVTERRTDDRPWVENPQSQSPAPEAQAPKKVAAASGSNEEWDEF
jgi:methyl-accepting chemotaxis protein